MPGYPGIGAIEAVSWLLGVVLWLALARRRADGRSVVLHLLDTMLFATPLRTSNFIPKLPDQIVLVMAIALVIWTLTIGHRLIYGP